MKNEVKKHKRCKEVVREVCVANEDENAILYTLFGLLIWFIVVSCTIMTCDFFGLLDGGEKDDGKIERFEQRPRPVIIPDPEQYDEEEFEELIERNPIRSTMNDYKVI